LLEPEGGMPIGLMPDVEFCNMTLDLKQGDIFVLYSDGISEARNKKKEDYEMDRLTEIVKVNRDGDAKKIKENILKNVQQFVGSAPQHDDMTVLVIKILK